MVEVSTDGTSTDGPSSDHADSGHAGPEERLDAASTRRRATVIGLAALLVLLIAAGGAWLIRDRASLRDDNERLVTKLEIARGDAGDEIASLEQRNEELAEQIVALDAELAATQDRLDATISQLDETSDALSDRSDELSAAKERADELENELGIIGSVTAPMPNVLGGTLEDVEAFADEIGAVLMVEEANATNVIGRPGSIIEQLPAEGVVIVPGSVIWIQLFVPAD